MSTTTSTLHGSAVGDALVVAKRNLIKIKRVPDLLVFTTMSPIMFILLFAYVFGGAIDQESGGDAYREFLIAGIFAQTVVFGATITGAGLAEDVKKGIIDRFRSLPMAPSAVLTGRTVSDVANNILVLIVMSLTGLLVGWAIHSSPAEAALGFLLLLIFAYAVSWIMAWRSSYRQAMSGRTGAGEPVAKMLLDAQAGQRASQRPRSSGDRAPASGAGCAGSNPAEGTRLLTNSPTACLVGGHVRCPIASFLALTSWGSNRLLLPTAWVRTGREIGPVRCTRDRDRV